MRGTLIGPAALALAACLTIPESAWGAGHAGLELPWWSPVPFGLLLLAIAVLPLASPHLWEKNSFKAVISAALAAAIFAFLVNQGEAGKEALVHELLEYGSFITLLGALYTVSGGILLRGDLRGRPPTNTVLLAIGAVLANLIGTTGASMLLIRPFLRINSQRKRVHHLPVFFIFVVSNVGGLLTPLGDPPLFLGFLKGVSFFWTFQLWREWLAVNGIVLLVFLVWDTIAYLREPPEALARDRAERQPLQLMGGINFLFLIGILLGVLFQSPIMGGLVRPWGEVIMLTMAAFSLLLTPRGLRRENGFTWHAILEVAILFAGIFITMIPALKLLERHGGRFGITEPWQYFWLTGSLSSFLDNAPTYLTFAIMAAGSEDLGALSNKQPHILAAISCGAVFMGANTYIGNGPNFMVKAIAEAAGFPTPSFLKYTLYSSLILLPIFVVITFLFFPL